MFDFTCDVCSKEIKSESHCNLDMWIQSNPEHGNYFYDLEHVCECCATEIKDSIEEICNKKSF